MICKDCGSCLELYDVHFIETPDRFGVIKSDKGIDFNKEELTNESI